MTPGTRSLTVLSTLFVILSFPMLAMAQVFPQGNGISLSGMNRSDIYVNITDWSGLDEAPHEFQIGVRQQLEETLGEAGIRRYSAGRNYLVCNLQAVAVEGQVVYTSNVEFWTLRSTDVHTLSWRANRIGTTDRSRFQPQLAGTVCAEQFLEEWRRWNG